MCSSDLKNIAFCCCTIAAIVYTGTVMKMVNEQQTKGEQMTTQQTINTTELRRLLDERERLREALRDCLRHIEIGDGHKAGDFECVLAARAALEEGK